MTTAEEKMSDSERLLFGGRLREDFAWTRHNGAFLEMSLLTMMLRLPRLLALTARLAYQADARALRRVVAAEVGRGAAQAVGMVQVNHVLAALLAAGTTADRLREADRPAPRPTAPDHANDSAQRLGIAVRSPAAVPVFPRLDAARPRRPSHQ